MLVLSSVIAESQDVNWLVVLLPVLVSVGGGTIVGNLIVAKFKEGIDRRQAIAQRVRDGHIARADTLRKVIAAIVGARSAASDARHTDLNRKSNIEKIADRSRANHERHVDNFERLSDEALVEAERYGLIPEWSGLPDRHLSSYVGFVLSGRLGFTLGADSYDYGNAGDAYQHATALIRDLRELVDAEEAQAHDAFVSSKQRKAFRTPSLLYFNELKFYYKGDEVNVKQLDMSVLESRLAREEWEEAERQKRRDSSRLRQLQNADSPTQEALANSSSST